MKAVPTAVISLAALVWTGCVALADNCDHFADRAAAVSADGAATIRIDAKAGSLRVHGVEGMEVRASGTACASDEELLDQIQLTADRSGSEVRVVVEIPDSGGGWNRQARLDLVVEVPKTIALEVNDTSGAMEVRDVAALEVHDSSGEIEIEDVAGDLRVEDSSGEIDIERVSGEVRIEDSSGEIDIAHVERSVIIERDSSGEIDVAHVKGDVLVERDGSGGIYVEDVGGDFTVERDGSGSIRHRDVAGQVDIPEKKR
jgi:hypothetical protein